MIKWQAIFNPNLALESLPIILEGLPYTLFLSLIGFTLGIIFGFFVALLNLSRWRLLRFIAKAHISFMRGTPMVVLMFLIYFGLPFMGIRFDAISASIISFTLMSSAYSSEVIRAALNAVDSGQWDAARSLGLSHAKILKRIIVPQALRVAVPPLSNILLDIVKGTSLTAMITVPEIFNKAKIVGGGNQDYMTVYITVALIYWVICTAYSFGQLYLEKKLAVY